FDKQGNVITPQAVLGRSFDPPPVISADMFDVARSHAPEPLLLPDRTGVRIRALALLDPDANTFIYTERILDPKIVAQADEVENAAAQYEQIQGQRGRTLTAFSLIFIVVALLLLLAAVWAALILATRLVRPVSTLVAAAGRIGAGDLA